MGQRKLALKITRNGPDETGVARTAPHKIDQIEIPRGYKEISQGIQVEGQAHARKRRRLRGELIALFSTRNRPPPADIGFGRNT